MNGRRKGRKQNQKQNPAGVSAVMSNPNNANDAQLPFLGFGISGAHVLHLAPQASKPSDILCVGCAGRNTVPATGRNDHLLSTVCLSQLKCEGIELFRQAKTILRQFQRCATREGVKTHKAERLCVSRKYYLPFSLSCPFTGLI